MNVPRSEEKAMKYNQMKTLKAIIAITFAMLTTALADRSATITFVDGHVSEITCDKYVQPDPVYTKVISGIPAGTQVVSTEPIGNMPSTPLFDNMKLIRLGHTKAQVSAYVGAACKNHAHDQRRRNQGRVVL
jgi:prepilin-type processing-associated H-X9-DG protein